MLPKQTQAARAVVLNTVQHCPEGAGGRRSFLLDMLQTKQFIRNKDTAAGRWRSHHTYCCGSIFINTFFVGLKNHGCGFCFCEGVGLCLHSLGWPQDMHQYSCLSFPSGMKHLSIRLYIHLVARSCVLLCFVFCFFYSTKVLIITTFKSTTSTRFHFSHLINVLWAQRSSLDLACTFSWLSNFWRDVQKQHQPLHHVIH
jgi:hypothetical protein